MNKEFNNIKQHLNKFDWDQYGLRVLTQNPHLTLSLEMISILLFLWNGSYVSEWFTDQTYNPNFRALLNLGFIHVNRHLIFNFAIPETKYQCSITRLGIQYILFTHLNEAFNQILHKSNSYVPIINDHNYQPPKVYVHFTPSKAMTFQIGTDIIICALLTWFLIAIHLGFLTGIMFFVSFGILELTDKIVHKLDPDFMDGDASSRNLDFSVHVDTLRGRQNHLIFKNQSAISNIYHNQRYNTSLTDFIIFLNKHNYAPNPSQSGFLKLLLSHCLFNNLTNLETHSWIIPFSF